MTGKFVSWARKSGKFVKGTQNFSYDNIVLYVIEKGEVYSRPDAECSGKPINFHEVKVPSARWLDVVGVDFKELDNLINHDISVFYDLSTYNGQPKVRLSSVKFQ